MNPRMIKVGYYVSTVLLTLPYLGGAFQYLTKNERIMHAYSNEMINGDNAIGFPEWLVLPMGVLKVFGVIAIWAPVPRWIKEWAYAAVFFNLLLAIGAHVFNPINPEDGDAFIAVGLLVFLVLSRYFIFLKEGSLKAVKA